MRILTILLATCLLAGCMTTVTVTKPVFPTPPPELMVVPPQLQPITNPDDALTVVVGNDILALKYRTQLMLLQKWMNDTDTSINGKPKK